MLTNLYLLAADEAAKIAAPIEGGVAEVPDFFLFLAIFVLAVFVGFEIITKVPPTLHTPLMSGSNAISGIALVGAILVGGSGQGTMATVLGFVAIVFATVNVVGGFLVTHRMLEMFQRKPKQ